MKLIFVFIVAKNMAAAAWIKIGSKVQGVVDGHTKVAPAGDPKNSTIFN